MTRRGHKKTNPQPQTSVERGLCAGGMTPVRGSADEGASPFVYSPL